MAKKVTKKDKIEHAATPKFNDPWPEARIPEPSDTEKDETKFYMYKVRRAMAITPKELMASLLKAVAPLWAQDLLTPQIWTSDNGYGGEAYIAKLNVNVRVKCIPVGDLHPQQLFTCGYGGPYYEATNHRGTIFDSVRIHVAPEGHVENIELVDADGRRWPSRPTRGLLAAGVEVHRAELIQAGYTFLPFGP